MAVLDKADYGVITMTVTPADLNKIKSITEKRFGGSKPTHVHHIIKNRGGKWTSVSLWLTMDLDTINVYDSNEEGFVTTLEGSYISTIAPIKLD